MERAISAMPIIAAIARIAATEIPIISFFFRFVFFTLSFSIYKVTAFFYSSMKDFCGYVHIPSEKDYSRFFYGNIF